MKSFFHRHYKILLFMLSVLTIVVLGAVNYILKSDYTEDIVSVSTEQPMDSADHNSHTEGATIAEQGNTNFVSEQTVSVDTADSDVKIEPVQKLETEDTALSPSELAEELTRVYKQAVEEDNEGQLTNETKEYLFKLIENLKQLSEPDLASIIYYGELSAEVFDIANITLNPKSFLPFQNFVNSPLAEVGEPSKSSTQYTVEMGINFRSRDEDSFDTYMYSQQGNFSGVITVSPDEDYFEYLIEEINGVDVSTFADDVSFLVTDIREPVTFFFRGNTVGVDTIELSGINSSENITSLFIPFSSSTRASVTVSRDNGITTIGRWNFDFDGDNVTDYTVGNGKEFTYEEYENIFDILERDMKLSDTDRKLVRVFRKSLLEFIKEN